MNRDLSTDWRVFEDEQFTLDQCDSCLVPGYLILRLKGASTSLGWLSPGTDHALGAMLSGAVSAIEEVVAPERVYCLSFGEIEPRLHFHLFPRTRALLEAYWRATGTSGEPVNVPRLFEWARTAVVADRPLAAGLQGVEAACLALRKVLRA